ncbi:class I SAM-dependent methyltransferase [Pseudalkalibacillus berkeleyi]|uniref:Class I SAM-dependent methyltransferase n=1 Tax=Pseudalkalibacillus berkeleyi TaxID=1069813 RepID=A0ABS9H0E5_9BACL|nr:class I SAM-dependent methyltransferase [Pseudalkalibacillus berkeleyi]MCF6137313.1 class I SAM-dependent methyltransferase [Pseudalkalibacillus berkeleyi]
MIITTGGKAKSALRQRARNVGVELGIPYVDRNDQSIEKLLNQVHDGILVVLKDRFLFYCKGYDAPLFFHPNSSVFRMKRLMRGEYDPFIRIANLSKGKTILDCTLGWASDSIVASFVVGESGEVVGVEGSSTVSLLTRLGLSVYKSGDDEMVKAMQRIKVIEDHHLAVLKKTETNRFDVVYFDPMFEEAIVTSDGIAPLKKFAVYEPITEELIKEAKRVAKERVVLKDHWKSHRFEQFNFKVERRKTSLFHFGYIEV